jgi:predicted NBD/HSP70 family sugar kinase
MNDRAALQALALHGPLSRTELEHEIGLSKPAAAELLRRLAEIGLVRPDGYRPSAGPGPNARLWTIDERAGYAVGVDVISASFDVGIVDLTGTLVADRKINLRGSGPDPVPVLRRAVQELVRDQGLPRDVPRRAVVGISGSIDPVTGFLGYAPHLPRWYDFDVPGRLAEALEMPVTVENDVNLVATDELRHGCARGYRDVVLLWMSRGVAAAVLIDGRLHRGSRGAAGEVDFAPISFEGQRMSELIDAAAVLELAGRYGVGASRAATAVRRAVAAVNDGKQGAGDPDGFLAELAGRIAHATVIAVTLIDPQLVVLAGDIGVAGGDRLADRVADRLHRLVAHRPEVRPGTGRDHAVRHGALAAAIQQVQEEVFG